MPSTPDGRMDGVALSPLTVAFHNPAFNAALGSEIRAGDTDRDKLHWGGPYNPQDLNRYSYVRNNPMNATDPTGHYIELTRQEAANFNADVLSGMIAAAHDGDMETVYKIVQTGLAAAGTRNVYTGIAAAVAGLFVDGAYTASQVDIEALEWLQTQLLVYNDDVEDYPDTLIRIGTKADLYRTFPCENDWYCRNWKPELYVSWEEPDGIVNGGSRAISKQQAHGLFPYLGPSAYHRYACWGLLFNDCKLHSIIPDVKPEPGNTYIGGDPWAYEYEPD